MGTKKEIEKNEKVLESLSSQSQQQQYHWSSESSVFYHMLQRAKKNFKACGNASNWNETYIGKFTNMSYLPKFGIIKALSDYISNNTEEKNYPYTCTLPIKAKSCNETGFSVILLTHNVS